MTTDKIVSLLVVFILSACAVRARDGDSRAENRNADRAVVIEVGAMKLTNRMLELRCELRNASEQDVWVYSENSARYMISHPLTNAAVFFDGNHHTVVALRRMRLPYDAGVWGEYLDVSYVRVPSGTVRAEMFSVLLLFPHPSDPVPGFAQPVLAEDFTQLAFEIGYYTADDLHGFKKDLRPSARMRFSESGERVSLSGLIGDKVYGSERRARVTIGGIHIPVEQWARLPVGREPPGPPIGLIELRATLRRRFFLNRRSLPARECRYAEDLFRFDRSIWNQQARQLADIYLRFASEEIDASDLMAQLDAVMSREQRERLLSELKDQSDRIRFDRILVASQSHPFTAKERLRDLYFDSSIGLAEYEYARKLFDIDDDLRGEVGQQMADVYRRTAEGALSASELSNRLDAILDPDGRRELLRELQEKQAARAATNP